MRFADDCGLCPDRTKRHAVTAIGGVKLCADCLLRVAVIAEDANDAPRRSPLTRVPKEVAR